MSQPSARWLKKMRTYRDAGASFIALWVGDGEEADLIYYLQFEGTVEALTLRSEGRSVPSIYGIFGGADWAEREACRNYRIKFVGNPNLILGENDMEASP